MTYSSVSGLGQWEAVHNPYHIRLEILYSLIAEPSDVTLGKTQTSGMRVG